MRSNGLVKDRHSREKNFSVDAAQYRPFSLFHKAQQAALCRMKGYP